MHSVKRDIGQSHYTLPSEVAMYFARYAGSDRVQNVIIRGSRVQPANRNNKVNVFQTITWDAPPNHHNDRHYVIKYQMQGQPTSSETRTSSNATQATLVLLVPQGQTSTYSVWAAAVSEAGQGEFSDRVDFNYSSKSTQQTCSCVHVHTQHMQCRY